MADNKINLKVRDTKSVIFEGEVDRISSFNEVGPFDIYPQHANFISIIHKKLLLYLDGVKIKEIDFERAILKIKKDRAKIFLGVDVLTMDGENQRINFPEGGETPPKNAPKTSS